MILSKLNNNNNNSKGDSEQFPEVNSIFTHYYSSFNEIFENEKCILFHKDKWHNLEDKDELLLSVFKTLIGNVNSSSWQPVHMKL